MKKIIASLLMFAMLAALTVVGVSALTPSVQEKEITLVSATVNGEDATEKILVTPYSKRDNLKDEAKNALVAAHDELTKGIPDVVTGEYKVGGLCDISWIGEEPLPENATIKVVLKVALGDAEIASIYEDVKNNKWDVAECTYENGLATLTLKHLCPVALLVEDKSVIVSDGSGAPQTGDDMSTAVIAIGALLVSGAVAALVVCRKRENV